MRLISILLATAAMIVAGSAGAVELSLVGASASGQATIDVGQNLTIELRMTNNNQLDGIYGLGASAHEYAAGLSFVSGRAVRNYKLGTDAPLANLSGVASSAATPPTLQRILAESAIGANGNRVQIGLSADVSGHFLDGLNTPDVGLEGAGTPMFRLVFRGLNPGTYDILFDSSYQGDLVNLDPAGDPNSAEIVGTSFRVTVVPEPGTALLMGLGLAGLASAGRRRS